jgi:hypothetical protein
MFYRPIFEFFSRIESVPGTSKAVFGTANLIASPVEYEFGEVSSHSPL